MLGGAKFGGAMELDGVGCGCGASELKGGKGREEGEPYESSKFEYPYKSKSEYPNESNGVYLFKCLKDFIFSFFKDLIGELLRIL